MPFLPQTPPTALGCSTGAAALPFLAQHLEDEHTERGLCCHIELQVQSEHDELCVGHEVQGKPPHSLPLLRGESGEEIWAKRFRNSPWTWGASSQHPQLGEDAEGREGRFAQLHGGWKCFYPPKSQPGSCQGARAAVLKVGEAARSRT